MMKGVDLDKYVADNLIGTPEQVCAKVAAFEEAGLDGFYAVLFVANTVDEMAEQMRLFARYVIPAFPDKPGTAESQLAASRHGQPVNSKR